MGNCMGLFGSGKVDQEESFCVSCHGRLKNQCKNLFCINCYGNWLRKNWTCLIDRSSISVKSSAIKASKPVCNLQDTLELVFTIEECDIIMKLRDLKTFIANSQSFLDNVSMLLKLQTKNLEIGGLLHSYLSHDNTDMEIRPGSSLPLVPTPTMDNISLQLREQLVPKVYMGKVIAVYKYAAKLEDELIFQKDSLIYVLKKHDDGWWEGVCNGKMGFFPKNYVKPFV